MSVLDNKKVTPIHILLFVLTLGSTLIAGLIQKGIDPLTEPARILEGLPFALTLMTILLTHELAHYYASRINHIIATLPYFIPAPSIIGTFGAFIKMKSPIFNRRALIDVGASGPIAGFIVSLIASVGGLYHSEIIKTSANNLGLQLGDSLLFRALSMLIVGNPPAGYDILLSPVAFAGWIGFLVTSLNLIPVGQLDGGHIAFAIFGGRHRFISRGLIAILLVLGALFWNGWIVWGVLLIILGPNHPPVIYWEEPVDISRQKMAFVSLIIFILTFIPNPFKIIR